MPYTTSRLIWPLTANFAARDDDHCPVVKLPPLSSPLMSGWRGSSRGSIKKCTSLLSSPHTWAQYIGLARRDLSGAVSALYIVHEMGSVELACVLNAGLILCHLPFHPARAIIYPRW